MGGEGCDGADLRMDDGREVGGGAGSAVWMRSQCVRNAQENRSHNRQDLSREESTPARKGALLKNFAYKSAGELI